MSKIKLAIVSTHPIQYYAPVFRALALVPGILPRVFFTWSQGVRGAVPDAGFGRDIEWDIPLLDGYEHEVVPNLARHPGVDHFGGVRTPTLTSVIERWGADAVLVFGWNLHAHLQAMRRFKGQIPIFFRGDSTLLDTQPPLRRLARTVLLSWVYRHIDVAIAVGSHNRDYFLRHGVPAQRVAFAPHSIDIRRYSAANERQEAAALRLRDELRIPATARVFLFAGKLQDKKDPLLLLDAFLPLRSACHLVFCGDGPLEREIRTRSAADPRVRFLPFQNQSVMPVVHRLADVFILPSRGPGETWGLALNEAMACGRPVIASSKVGGARDLIRDRHNGWTFEAGNRTALAQLLETASTMDRAALRAMGTLACKTSLEWSSEATAAAIAEVVMQFHPGAVNQRIHAAV